MGKESVSKVSKIELGVIIGLMLVIIFGENLYLLITKEQNNNSNNDNNSDKDSNSSNNIFKW